MSILLRAVESELGLLNLEIESLQDLVNDQAASELYRCAANLRLMVMRPGQKLLEQVMINELEKKDINTLFGDIHTG